MTATTPSIRSKLFVLDTNVILHDAGCLKNFQENDIAIPITVLEELDRFKKGNEDLNFQARAFLRRLDELTSDVLSDEGTPLGAGLGKIRVVLRGDHGDELQKAFFSDAPDHRILDIALTLKDREQPRSVKIHLSPDPWPACVPHLSKSQRCGKGRSLGGNLYWSRNQSFASRSQGEGNR